jgi:hypothetical protein
MHVREDHLMSALLTVRTERRNDGTLVLKAAGEIDMSNVDTWLRRSPAPSAKPGAATKRSPST